MPLRDPAMDGDVAGSSRAVFFLRRIDTLKVLNDRGVNIRGEVNGQSRRPQSTVLSFHD
jgi:hypothetical protein